MGKTKRSKTPGGNKVMTTMTADPLLPDAFDMSDVCRPRLEAQRHHSIPCRTNREGAESPQVAGGQT